MRKIGFFRKLAEAAFAMVALGAFAVSCETMELQDSIDDLTDRVTVLETQVAKLQSSVDATGTIVETLTSGKLIQSVTESKDGTYYTITYVGENIEPDVIYVGTEETPALTVMVEEDVYYWAKIDAGSGEAVHLVDGKKIPVVTEGGATTQFREKDGQLEVSIDGGSEWLGTGVDFNSVGAIFKSVSFDGDYVVFTFQDGTELRVNRVAELACDITSGKVYFEAGQTKRLTVEAAGYDKYELATPQGWTAKYSGNIIEVTAPADGADGDGGEVVLRVYADGDVVIDKVAVQIGASLLSTEISEAEDGTVTITVSASGYAAPVFYFGISKKSEFSADAAAVAAASEKDLTEKDERQYKQFMERDMMSGMPKPFTVNLTDYIKGPVAGESYVIWIIENTAEDPVPELVQTVTYVYGAEVAVSVENITFNDADVKITPVGVGYYYGISTKEYFYASSIPRSINAGQYAINKDEITGKFSEINALQQTQVNIKAGETYVIWTAIASDEKMEYTVDDIMTKEFTLAEYSFDGSAEMSFSEAYEATSTSVKTSFTFPDNTYELYCTSLDDAGYKSYGSDDNALIKDMLATLSPFSYDDLTGPNANLTIEARDLSPEETVWFLGVVVDNEGKVGPVAKLEAKSTPITYNTEIGVSAPTPTVTQTSATVNFTFTGSPAKMIYYSASLSTFENDWEFGGDVAKVEEKMALDQEYYYWSPSYPMYGGTVSLEGKESYQLDITGLSFGTDYVVIAKVVSADGQVSEETVYLKYTTSAPVVVAKDNPEYTANAPTVGTITYEGDEYGVTAYIPITVGENVKEWYATYYYGSYEVTDVNATLNELLKETPRTGSGTLDRMLWSGDTYTYVITWVDNEGRYYEPMTVEVPYQAATL